MGETEQAWVILILLILFPERVEKSSKIICIACLRFLVLNCIIILGKALNCTEAICQLVF